MKSVLFLPISASMLLSHSALATQCRLIMKDSNLSYYKGEKDMAYDALKKLGYSFEEWDAKNEKEESIKLHFQLANTKDSTLGCAQTVQIRNSTVDGKASELLFEKTSHKLGFKAHKAGDPCENALEKAVRSVPSCQEMIKKVGSSQSRDADKIEASSGQPSAATAKTAAGTQ